MIRNIIFDIGNVLVDWDWPAYLDRLFGNADITAFLTKRYWQSGLWQEMDRGSISQETIHRELLENAEPYREEMELAYQRMGECISLFDYTNGWITELKNKGYGVYFLSNYSDYLIDKNPEALTFTKLMDGGIFSCHVKLVKPDLVIYDTLCKCYDLDPAECLFIDDKLINVIAAKEYGMHAIRFSDYAKTKPIVDSYLETH